MDDGTQVVRLFRLFESYRRTQIQRQLVPPQLKRIVSRTEEFAERRAAVVGGMTTASNPTRVVPQVKCLSTVLAAIAIDFNPPLPIRMNGLAATNAE